MPAAASPPPEDERPVWLYVGLASVVAVAVLSGVLLTQGSTQTTDDVAAAPTSEVSASADASDPPEDGVSNRSDGPVPEGMAFTEGENGSLDDDTNTVPEETAPSTERRAYIKGGILYLEGAIPSQALADLIVERSSAVMGPDRVVNNYTIDPASTFDPNQGAPLYVEDLVLFPTGSAEFAPEAVPLLQLGVVLMTQFDTVTIDVIGHTDSLGSDADNLALSQARIDAVVSYWVAAGIDPSRVIAIAKGEAEPLADNSTEEGRQLNRRVEFVITGLLG